MEQGTVNEEFWSAIDRLVASSEMVVERPAGSRHPAFPSISYPADYGYLAGTSSMDGSGIDIWNGSAPELGVTGIICTVDLAKRDSEIKILFGCTEDEQQAVCRLLNQHRSMKGLQVSRDPRDTG